MFQQTRVALCECHLHCRLRRVFRDVACLFERARIEDAFLFAGMNKNTEVYARKNTLRTLSKHARLAKTFIYLPESDIILPYYITTDRANRRVSNTTTTITKDNNINNSTFNNIIKRVVCAHPQRVRGTRNPRRMFCGILSVYGPLSTRGHFPARYIGTPSSSGIRLLFRLLLLLLFRHFFFFCSTCMRAQEECRITKLSLIHIILSDNKMHTRTCALIAAAAADLRARVCTNSHLHRS